MNLRKRSASALGIGLSGDGPEEALSAVEFVKTHGISMKKIVIFSGSGLSASSGMSMFSTRNGLYDRARKQFKISDGLKLFTYSFYKQRKDDVQAFFAEIYSEAQGSKAAAGHYALAEIGKMGCIKRHYTLNIDGLAEAVGIDTWHHENNPNGITVEMHGNIRQLVCPSCHSIEPLSRDNIAALTAKKSLQCQKCSSDYLRFKVMLYDDAEGDCITPEGVFDLLEKDLEDADAVIWLGISFEQSASVEYFRRVRHLLGASGRMGIVKQAIVNPSDDAYFNLVSSCSNADGLQLMDVRATSDELLPLLSKAMSNPEAFSRESVMSVSGNVTREDVAAYSSEVKRSKALGGRRPSNRSFVFDSSAQDDQISDESEQEEEEEESDDEGFLQRSRSKKERTKKRKQQKRAAAAGSTRKHSLGSETQTHHPMQKDNWVQQQGTLPPIEEADEGGSHAMFGSLSSAPNDDHLIIETLIRKQQILIEMQAGNMQGARGSLADSGEAGQQN